MNTQKKGNEFEEQVFQTVKKELESGCLFVNGATSKIFKRKAYFSRDRESNIIIDISIEAFIPNGKELSLLIAIECKDYNRSISINEIEEFYCKVQQISGANIKAIFATRSALQKSALKYAKAKKIAILRLLAEEKVEWQVYMIEPDPESVFLEQQYFANGKRLFVCDGNCVYETLSAMLEKYL